MSSGFVECLTACLLICSEEAKQLEESMERVRQERAAAEKQAACIRQVWMQITAQNNACVENIAMMEALKEQLSENVR